MTVVTIGRAFATKQRQGVTSHSITALPVPRIPLTINANTICAGGTISTTPDSGASSTILAASTARQLGLRVDRRRQVKIQDAQGRLLLTEGIAAFSASLPGGRLRQLEVVVCKSLSETCLLSYMDQILLGCLDPNWPHTVIKDDPTSEDFIQKQNNPRVRQRLRILQRSQTPMENGQAYSVTAEVDEDSLFPKKSPLPPMPTDFKKLFEQFEDVTADHLAPHHRMASPPLDLKVRTNTIPHKVFSARPIPIHMFEPAKRLWEKMIEAKVIRVLGPNEETSWLSAGFFVPKVGQFDENGAPKVRAVVDWKILNRAIIRGAPHPFRTGRDIWQKVDHKARVYAKLDLVSSYWQVGLTPAASQLTAFICAFGRAVFLSAGMGINVSSDAYCSRSDQLLAEAPCHKSVDDLLIEAPNYGQLLIKLRRVLDVCRSGSITISRSKIMIGSKVTFGGAVFDEGKCRPDPEKTQAIREWPAPRTATEVRAFCGLATQLGSWIPHLSMLLRPLRALTRKDAVFLWTRDHSDALHRTKEVLCGPLVMSAYNPDITCTVYTDASGGGFGFLMTQPGQQEGKAGERLIWAGSRVLSGPESRYAPILAEATAVSFALTKLHHYLKFSKPFDLFSDHSPLASLHAANLDSVPERLLNLVEHWRGYPVTIKYMPGRSGGKIRAADFLSRPPPPAQDSHSNPGSAFTSADQLLETARVIDESFKDAVMHDPLLQDIMMACRQDSDYRQICTAIHQGKAAEQIKLLPTTHPCRQLASVWNQLSLLDPHRPEGSVILFDGDKIFPPPAARPDLLNRLHLDHSGVAKARRKAAARFFWPGMAEQVAVMCRACQACRECERSLPADPPLLPTRLASTYPMHRVAADVLSYGGKCWLIMVDVYSGFPLVRDLGKRQDTQTLIKVFTRWFQLLGYPSSLRTDYAPSFHDSFSAWAKAHGIRHELSSSFNSRSNGLCERFCGIVRKIFEKSDSDKRCRWVALSEWRLTPRADSPSPATLFYRRHTRSGYLPGIARHPSQADIAQGERARDHLALRRVVSATSHAPLPPLQVGQEVLVQHPVGKPRPWREKAKVVGCRRNGRSYIIQSLDSDRLKIRSRKFLKLCEPLEAANVATIINSRPPRELLSCLRGARITAQRMREAVMGPAFPLKASHGPSPSLHLPPPMGVPTGGRKVHFPPLPPSDPRPPHPPAVVPLQALHRIAKSVAKRIIDEKPTRPGEEAKRRRRIKQKTAIIADELLTLIRKEATSSTSSSSSSSPPTSGAQTATPPSSPPPT